MREKLSYPVRIIISLLSIFLWSFPAEGQDSESLRIYLGNFKFTAHQQVHILIDMAFAFHSDTGSPPDQLYTEFVGTNKVRIDRKTIQDTLEESASPTAYVLYSRKDNGGFDNGTLVKGEEIILPIEVGIIQSYKIATVNKGDISFPFEALQTPSERNRLMKSTLHFSSFQQQNKIQYIQ